MFPAIDCVASLLQHLAKNDENGFAAGGLELL
jgi:hypothetical protein